MAAETDRPPAPSAGRQQPVCRSSLATIFTHISGARNIDISSITRIRRIVLFHQVRLALNRARSYRVQRPVASPDQLRIGHPADMRRGYSRARRDRYVCLAASPGE